MAPAPRAADPSDRLGRPRVRLLVGGAVALAVLAVAGAMLGQRADDPGPIGMTVALALSFGPLGVFVLRRLPQHVLGRLMVTCGLSAAGAVIAVCWSARLVPAWFSQWLWLPPLVLIPFMLLRFPDGLLPSRRWQVTERLLAGSAGLAVLSLALAATQAPRTLLTSIDTPLSGFTQVLQRVALASLAGVALGALAVGVGVATRWRTASALGRRQLACLLPSALLLVGGLILDFVNVPGGWLPAVVALPLGLTLAILQYRLYDLDLFIHRGVVWLVLTALAVAVYAVAVGLGERWLAGRGSFSLAIVAGALVAAVLLPAERLVQRAVGRLLFGRRDDPYAVLTQVGRHIEGVTDPLAVLPRFAATLVTQLRVPYAALVVHPTSEDTELVVEHGRRVSDPERFPMRAHGVEVGALLVAHRRPGEHFSVAESRLLHDLAGQAAVAAEACRSTLEIQRARERLVFAREEERRQLRRDLHDGVASGLVGARMLATAARTGVTADGSASTLLDRLTADLDSCTEEVRALVDGLRPAALDRGLAAALADLVDRTPSPGPQWSLELAGELHDLPAAVEVVAYRIVTEAVTNVVKHARAGRGSVQVTAQDHQLTILVTDDGAGRPADSHPTVTDARHGVGLTSIRSRVEEVGGEFSVVFSSAGGELLAVLPAPSAAPKDFRPVE